MFESPGIPKGLAEMPPGAFLGGILESIDRASLSGRDRVLLLKAERRQASHYQARVYATMSAVQDSITEVEEIPLDQVVDAATDELRAALTLTRRSAGVQLDLATTLVSDYPQVLAALDAGVIDVPKAMVLVQATSHLEAEHRTAVVDTGLEQAATQTTGQLRARLDRLAMTIDPDTARRRYQESLEDRRVVVEANPDGTAGLYGMSLPPADTQAALRHVNRIARSLKSKAETRTLDQLRADVLLDLLNGRGNASGTNRGGVEITVDLEALAGLSETPGELNGYGPVIADIARQVTQDQAHTTHQVTVTRNGEPVWTGTTRRRPTTAIARTVRARNRTCVFPGCRMPAIDCDLDHTVDYAQGGPTTEANLAPSCRHDHIGKHKRGWQLKRVTPGTYQWTSPLGHTYTVGPDPP